MSENPSIRTEFTKQTDCEEKLKKLSLGDDSCESEDEGMYFVEFVRQHFQSKRFEFKICA